MEDTIIQHIDEWDAYQNCIKSKQGCIVKYTASWCGPCKKIAPTYQALAKQHHDKITFLEVDIDNADEIATFEQVRSIPLFLFYDRGRQCKELTTLGGNIELLQTNVAKFVELLGTPIESTVVTPITNPSLSNLADDDIDTSSSNEDTIPELDVEEFRTLAEPEEPEEPKEMEDMEEMEEELERREE